VSLDLDAVLRVIEACDALVVPEPLISFVFSKRGGGSAQVFLRWIPGRPLKDYIRDPALTGGISLYQAAYSRILDHKNIKRRLSYVPQEGDELRFIRSPPAREM
jgi:hypothetical protein